MKHEIPQDRLDAAWAILQAEGVSILPKRNLVIPKPNQVVIANSFGPRYVKPVLIELKDLNDFLEMVPIADRFNKDHDTRREWRSEMIKKLGTRIFYRLYENRNQFRVNNLIIPILAFQELRGITEESHYSGTKLETIRQLNESTFDVLSNYAERELDGKLEIVHFIEDRCIEGLALFA